MMLVGSDPGLPDDTEAAQDCHMLYVNGNEAPKASLHEGKMHGCIGRSTELCGALPHCLNEEHGILWPDGAHLGLLVLCRQ